MSLHPPLYLPILLHKIETTYFLHKTSFLYKYNLIIKRTGVYLYLENETFCNNGILSCTVAKVRGYD